MSSLDRANIGIDRDIGSAYDNVKLVADNIDAVVLLSDSLGSSSGNIEIVSSNISTITAVGSGIADVNIVAADISSVVTVSTNISDVSVVATNIVAVQNASSNAISAAASADSAAISAASLTYASVIEAQALTSTTRMISPSTLSGVLDNIQQDVQVTGNVSVLTGYLSVGLDVPNPSSSDQAFFGVSIVNGAELIGQGTVNDVVLLNSTGVSALRVPTGTIDVVIEGLLTTSFISTSGKIVKGLEPTPANPNADDLILSTSGETGLTIFSGSTSSGWIGFGSFSDNLAGRIVYDQSSGTFSIGVAGVSGNLVLDSTGLTIIGEGIFEGQVAIGASVGLNSKYAQFGDSTSSRELDFTQYQVDGIYDNAGHLINATSGFGELSLAVGGTTFLIGDPIGTLNVPVQLRVNTSGGVVTNSELFTVSSDNGSGFKNNSGIYATIALKNSTAGGNLIRFSSASGINKGAINIDSGSNELNFSAPNGFGFYNDVTLYSSDLTVEGNLTLPNGSQFIMSTGTANTFMQMSDTGAVDYNWRFTNSNTIQMYCSNVLDKKFELTNLNTGRMDLSLPTGVLSVGAGFASATGGVINMNNAGWITTRNASNSADINMIRVNLSNEIQLGDGANVSITGNIIMGPTQKFLLGGSSATYLQEYSLGNVALVAGGVQIMDVNSTTVSIISSDLSISDGSINVSSALDITPIGSNGQLNILGAGYSGSIALDGTAMYVGHNSGLRDLVFRTSNATRMTIGGGGGTTVVGNFTAATSANEHVYTANATTSLFTGTTLRNIVSRAATGSYQFFLGYSGGTELEFSLNGNGNGTCEGTWTGGGADYAERFDRLDGSSPLANNWAGKSVVLDNGKTRLAQNDEIPFAVVSLNPSVIGDGDIGRWKGKYIRTDYGNYDLDSEGYRQLNPEYDPDLTYVDRADRMDAIGLVGKLRINNNQPVAPNWIKMREISETVTEYFTFPADQNLYSEMELLKQRVEILEAKVQYLEAA